MSKLNKFVLLRDTALSRLIATLQCGNEALTDDSQKAIFSQRVAEIQKTYSEFEQAHNNIISLIDPKDFSEYDAVRIQGDALYFNIKALSNKMFSVVELVQTPMKINKMSSKLPKLNLGKFQGKATEWPAFFDLYNSLVHNNDCLSNIEKFHHLLTSLEGEPHNLIKGLPLTDSNYEIAYNTLHNRYQNKRLLATTYYLNLQNLQPLFKVTATDLRFLLDTFNENVSALKSLKFPVDSWDFILFNMMLQKLDNNTRTKFEIEHSSFEIPTYKQLLEFLEKYSKAFESSNLIYSPKNKSNYGSHFTARRSNTSTSLNVTNVPKPNVSDNVTKCVLCNAIHCLYQCPQFLGYSITERFNFASRNNLCKNCLSSIHTTSRCNSSSKCRICKANHHTLIHLGNSKSNIRTQNNTQLNARTSISSQNVTDDTNENSQSQPQSNTQSLSVMTNTLGKLQTTVLLSTAIVHVKDILDNFQTVRVLLDTGSMANFISESCVNRLGLKRINRSLSIQGLGNQSSVCSKGVTFCHMKPLNAVTPLFNFEAVIVPLICANQPQIPLCPKGWPHITNLELADPKYYVPSAIDILIGAELTPYIIKGNHIFGDSSSPVALESLFGWILQGKASIDLNGSSKPVISNYHISSDVNLDVNIQKFWELDKIPSSHSLMSSEESQCEEIFQKTTSRAVDGRFTVVLPFKHSEPILGDSYNQALRRFLLLENKLSKDSTLKSLYYEFMKDYLDCRHMSLVSDSELDFTNAYYIPHHSIYRPESLSTKLRVVFDASAKTSTGISLNDTLLVGQKLQKDIFSILLNFRIFPIAFTCDVKQMFRQISIASHHRHYQRILWRFSENDPVQHYQLNTVTYGLACSPFLANRTIQELARLGKHKFPLAAAVVENYIYVDDIVCGGQDIDSTLKLQEELIGLMNSGKFSLRKWASNHSSIVKAGQFSEGQDVFDFDKEEPSSVKVLGLKWKPSTDTFFFTYSSRDISISKRTILSDISRIYDPLGFLTPCIIYVKSIMQQLWLSKVNWDESPSQEIVHKWLKFKNELSALSNISIPRYFLSQNLQGIELHAFADASETGYCAVTYIRIVHNSSNIITHFLASKSRIAPLKSLSIPRLELCAAVLLVDLVKLIKSTLSQIIFDQIYAWSDSQTTLAWLRSSPHTKKVFVANRVAHAQTILPEAIWHYVPSLDNPADCGSRGITPSQLAKHPLWWTGPKWLSLSSNSWPVQPNLSIVTNDEEVKRVTLNTMVDANFIDNLLTNHSSLTKIQNVIVYVLRFINNCKQPRNSFLEHSISPGEKQTALIHLVKHVQTNTFIDLFSNLLSQKPLPKPFRKLCLFVDEMGCLRVGGRLRNSDLTYETKHPLLLPKNHRLTELIIEHTHMKYLHPGFKTLHYLLLQQFWILSPRHAIYKCLSRCIKCFKYKPKLCLPPKMADLPRYRVSELKAFTIVCLDYAGPFSIKMSKIRNAKILKSYICIFVCCAVKAIHIELVSDLSSEAFIAAFRRFSARRGRCTTIISDQGTNFIGANNQFLEYARQAGKMLQISWQFNPPASPHFNGLSEAGVKSVKTHIFRVLGNQILTYEEFYTFLVQVEAVLNSRPLCASSSDPHDLTALTPSHFLILEPLNSTIAEPDLSHLTLNRLSRWQLLQRMYSDFWKRWHHEYLHELQQRSKWQNSVTNIQENTLVLIKDELKTPLHWELGRIVALHSGADGVTRIVSVKTKRGIFKRPVIKLCPLPIN